MKSISLAAGLFGAAALVAACGRSGAKSASSSPAEPDLELASARADEGVGRAPETAPPQRVNFTLAEVGLDNAALDHEADPCADFFQFTCGGWLAANPVDGRRPRWRRLDELRQRNHEELVALLGAASGSGDRSPAMARLATYYAACMDQAGVDGAGTSAITGLLEVAGAVKDPATLAAAMAELHRHGIDAGFALAAAPDFKDGTTTILFLDSAGLGLPDRDYYLEGKGFADIRRGYRSHVERVFKLLGDTRKLARGAARDVLRIETELARASKGRTERRLIDKLYNRVDRAGLAELAPRFPWAGYFAALGHGDLQAISVTTPRFFAGFSRQVRRIKSAAWRSYLRWQVVHASAAILPKAFADEARKLDAMLGRAPLARAQECLRATSAALGDDLGRAYVKRHFAGNSRETARLLVAAIEKAALVELGEADWLSEPARTAAVAKARALSSLVGYPDSWQAHDFTVDGHSYAANVLRARAHRIGRELEGVGKPRDRQAWSYGAHTVNGAYSWLDNRMTIPAGMLQPPFFSARHSIPVNLGGMAMIVGHELSHAFDDQGARFDGRGRLEGWWQAEDEAGFRARASCLVAQFDAYEAAPGALVDGRRTLAENRADLAGAVLGFRAYRSLRADNPNKVRADGYDEDQQFFIALGQAACGHAEAGELRRRLASDARSPARLRVNGTLRNMPEFAAAFSCAEGSGMRPATVCDSW